MARWKVAQLPRVEATDLPVPAELKDHQSPCWLDAARFKGWCGKHLGRELTFLPQESCGSDARFTRAVYAWADINGLVVEDGLTPWNRLRELGIQPVRRLRSVQAS